jgi:hypothetical protein
VRQAAAGKGTQPTERLNEARRISEAERGGEPGGAQRKYARRRRWRQPTERLNGARRISEAERGGEPGGAQRKYARRRRQRQPTERLQKGISLIEAVVGLCFLVPLILFAVDVAVVTCVAQMNEEFAEQLARLCSTVQSQPNATKACQDVIAKYETPANVKSLELTSVTFDVGLQQVNVTTSMVVNLPVPIFGQNTYTLTASAMQPIVSFPAPQ